MINKVIVMFLLRDHFRIFEWLTLFKYLHTNILINIVENKLDLFLVLIESINSHYGPHFHQFECQNFNDLEDNVDIVILRWLFIDGHECYIKFFVIHTINELEDTSLL